MDISSVHLNVTEECDEEEEEKEEEGKDGGGKRLEIICFHTIAWEKPWTIPATNIPSA